MAKEKQNTVRIFQSTKKNNISAIKHIAIGFFTGIIFTCLAGFTYLSFSVQEKSHAEHTQQVYTKTQMELSSAHNQPENSFQTIESTRELQEKYIVETENNKNLEDDLINAFKHPQKQALHSEKPITNQVNATKPQKSSAVKNTDKPSFSEISIDQLTSRTSNNKNIHNSIETMLTKRPLLDDEATTTP